MLNALRFAQGAVSRKSADPTLKHFRIKDGVLTAYNGVVCLNTPIECDLDVAPLAVPFVRAIGLCTDTVALHLTGTGRLGVRSEGFKAFIDCAVEPFGGIAPRGDAVEVAGGILEALQVLAPLMSEDASRPWSRGILLHGESAFATNNIVLAEHWLGYAWPVTIGLPAQCVTELLRINLEPVRVQATDKQVTFHFDGNRHLTSALLAINEWPDPAPFLNATGAEPVEVPDKLWEAVEKARPFADKMGRLYLDDGTVSTGQLADDEGAHIEVSGCSAVRGIYTADQLLRLRGVATRVDWTPWPRPCRFYGDKVRGVFIGLAE